MRCTRPRTVGFYPDGKTICWSPKKYSKEFATFLLPCGKCISCRLEYARQWAVRCIHEAQMHEKNSFITLTYDDAHLGDNRLDYEDFKLFMKRLRHEQEEPIGLFVTGEYGEKSKRKHWHALLFGYLPEDLQLRRTTERGDKVFTSETLSRLWPFGLHELGNVTFESAGYCARYSAKKLGHGMDQEHDFQPISKKSSKNAIGKKYIEKYWRSTFDTGAIVLPDGKGKCAIPRYYEKWLIKHQPEYYAQYLERVKSNMMERSAKKNEKTIHEARVINEHRANTRTGPTWTKQVTQEEAREVIVESKNKILNGYTKF